MVKVKRYKESDILFQESGGNDGGSCFSATIEGKVTQRKTLEEIIAYLDKLTKKDFKRIPIYYPAGSYGEPVFYVEGEITSIADNDLWISYGVEKARTKINFRGTRQLVDRTDKNKTKIIRINDLRSQAEKLLKQAADEAKTLEPVVLPSME